MELLDRYLQAVKKHLPWQRQDDIIAELKANLEAQLEDKEAALGRPLTKAEAEVWLKQFGHPIQAAAHYQPQRSLIGPALFPFYWYVLGIALFWATVIYPLSGSCPTENATNGRLVAAFLFDGGVTRWVSRRGQRFPFLVRSWSRFRWRRQAVGSRSGGIWKLAPRRTRNWPFSPSFWPPPECMSLG